MHLVLDSAGPVWSISASLLLQGRDAANVSRCAKTIRLRRDAPDSSSRLLRPVSYGALFVWCAEKRNKVRSRKAKAGTGRMQIIFIKFGAKLVKLANQCKADLAGPLRDENI